MHDITSEICITKHLREVLSRGDTSVLIILCHSYCSWKEIGKVELTGSDTL